MTSANRDRAKRLFLGGQVGWLVGMLLGLGAGAVIAGPIGAVSALGGSGLALAFHAIGQGVQIVVADAPARTVRAASVLSYVVRVGLLALLLSGAIGRPDILALFDARSIFAGIVCGVLGWIVGLVTTFRRLRVPVFDEGSQQR